MKLCIIDSGRVYGGQQVYIEKVLEIIDFTRFKITVITSSYTLYKRLSNNPEVEIYFLQTSKILSFLEVYRIVKKVKPNIILLNGQFEAHYSILLHSVPKYFIRHTPLSMTSYLKRLLYFVEALFFSKKVIVVNDFIKKEFPSFIRNKVEIIHNWTVRECEREGFHRIMENKDKYRLLYCGRIVKEKNVELICEACSNIDNVELHVIGEGKDLSRLVNLYKDFRNIKFHGFLDYQKVLEFYKESDIFLYVSNIEAFPLAVLDAFCFGIPCILSDIPAHRDISMNGYAAILVKPSVSEIRDAIIRLVQDEHYRTQLSLRALTRAKDFSMENARTKLLSLLQDVENLNKPQS